MSKEDRVKQDGLVEKIIGKILSDPEARKIAEEFVRMTVTQGAA